ncbi:unnamed protein product, partial [Cuscuta epithymum]
MTGIWRLFAFVLAVLVRCLGQEMEANHVQIKVLKEEDEVMKIRPPPELPPCRKGVTRDRNIALEDWIQPLNKFIVLNFIFPIFRLFTMKFVDVGLFFVFAYGCRFFTLTEGSARFDIVGGGRIYFFSSRCIKP